MSVATLSQEEINARPTRYEPKTMRLWHHAMMDYLLLNPTASFKEVAAEFAITEATAKYVVNSDMFQAQLRERRGKIAEDIDSSIAGKAKKLASRSLDALNDIVEHHARIAEKAPAHCDLSQMRETAEMALKAVGFGVPSRGTNQTQVNVTVVSSDELAKARELMRARRAGSIEHDAALPSPA